MCANRSRVKNGRPSVFSSLRSSHTPHTACARLPLRMRVVRVCADCSLRLLRSNLQHCSCAAPPRADRRQTRSQWCRRVCTRHTQSAMLRTAQHGIDQLTRHSPTQFRGVTCSVACVAACTVAQTLNRDCTISSHGIREHAASEATSIQTHLHSMRTLLVASTGARSDSTVESVVCQELLSMTDPRIRK